MFRILENHLKSKILLTTRDGTTGDGNHRGRACFCNFWNLTGVKRCNFRHVPIYTHTDTDKNDGSHIFTETYDEHLSTQN